MVEGHPGQPCIKDISVKRVLHVAHTHTHTEWNVDGMAARGSNLLGLCRVSSVLASIPFGENHLMDLDIREAIVRVAGKSSTRAGADWLNLHSRPYTATSSTLANAHTNATSCVSASPAFFEPRLALQQAVWDN